jgi:hypothetical protein
MVRSLLIASISAVVTFVAGCIVHARFFDARSEIQCLMQREMAGSHGAAVVSLSALLALEHHDTSAAKRQLARQIASYQRAFGKYDGALPDRPKLAPLIHTAAEQSSVLRDEIGKKAGE